MKQYRHSHYLHHFLLANVGLFAAYLIFGSITIWEVVLYFVMTFSPVADDFFYVVLHYLDEAECRAITHQFIAGNYTETFALLHTKRQLYRQLVLHNVVVYAALWGLLFVFLIFDIPLAFYGLFGLLVHLMQDLANDEYEFHTLASWLWPLRTLLALA